MCGCSFKMATDGTEQVDVDKIPESKQSYHCPICLEAVKTPRGLPCLHTFCEECLHTYICAAAEKDAKNILCPVCRKHIIAPELGIGHDEWARRFPLNYFVLTKQDNAPVHKTEECRFCLREWKKTRAEHYCKNCAEAICSPCKHVHTLIPILMNHSVVTLEQFRNNPTPPDIDEMCQVHTGKIVEVYCLDHKKMCCSICFATQHRHCSDVKSLDDCASELEEKTVEGIIHALESISYKLEKTIEEKVQLGEKMIASRDSAILKMTQHIEAAEKNLKILLENFKTEADNEHSKNYSKLEGILEALRGIKTSVVCDLQMLKAIVKCASKRQIFISLEKVKMQLAEQSKIAVDIAPTAVSQGYTVEDKALREIMKLKSVGSIQRIGAEKFALSDELISELAYVSRDHDKELDRDPQSLIWTKQWTVQLDGTCTSYGATFLGRNIATIPYGSGKITVISEKGSVLYCHKIPYQGKPAYIKAVDDCIVWISFQKEKILKKYKVTASAITETGVIHLKSIVEAFCIMNSKIFHACSKAVNISSMSGELIKSIPIKQTGDIGFLAGFQQRGIFCHTDGLTLCIMNMEGKEVKRVLLKCNPHGLGFDFQGNIYICCFNEGKLLQISREDLDAHEILHIPQNVYTIAFDLPRKSFVVITTGGMMQFHSLE